MTKTSGPPLWGCPNKLVKMGFPDSNSWTPRWIYNLIFDGPHRQVGPSLWLLILANIFHFAIDFALKGVTLEKVMGIIRFGDFEFSASPWLT